MNSDNNQLPKRAQWTSNFGFIMAAAGSAVGLGNLWKFPFLVGQNGGSAFIFVYLFFVIFIGITLAIAEIAIGRSTQLNPVDAYEKISPRLKWVGVLGAVSGVIILSYYAVVGGWILFYLAKSLLSFNSSLDYTKVFDEYTSNPGLQFLTFSIYFIINYEIIASGVQKGIEKCSKILMPALLVMMILVTIRTLTLDGAAEGVEFLLKPDFAKLDKKTILSAMGQVFFSLSLGVGTLLTFGSYLKKEDNMLRSAVCIPIIDTLVAILAAVAIMPAVFAYKLKPTAGPPLMFITLPTIFSKMPLGNIIGFVFFALVFFAAITSSISMLEALISFFVDHYKWDRTKAVRVNTAMTYLLGIPSALSFNILKDFHILPDKTIFDFMDFLASNIIMPVGGIALCIAVGWIWEGGIRRVKINDTSATEKDSYLGYVNNSAIKEITNNGKIKFTMISIWAFFLKWLCPVAILAIFIDNL